MQISLVAGENEANPPAVLLLIHIHRDAAGSLRIEIYETQPTGVVKPSVFPRRMHDLGFDILIILTDAKTQSNDVARSQLRGYLDADATRADITNRGWAIHSAWKARLGRFVHDDTLPTSNMSGRFGSRK